MHAMAWHGQKVVLCSCCCDISINTFNIDCVNSMQRKQKDQHAYYESVAEQDGYCERANQVAAILADIAAELRLRSLRDCIVMVASGISIEYPEHRC